MFYEHKVLTSREYGVATVWLIATLGQKSTARKVSRRDILNVNVPKACEMVITPEVPMALRLQSNLLYGVSRVYARQCEYILSDVQSAQFAIRTLLRVHRNANLDTDVTKARSDRITLQDDPAFVPDFSLVSFPGDILDLNIIGAGAHRRITDTASLHTTQSQHVPLVGLQLPNSTSPSIEGFQMPDSGSHGPRLSSLLARDEDDLFPDIGIGLDPEGNFIEYDDLPQLHVRGSGGSILPSDGGVQGGIRGTGQAVYPGLSAGLLGADDLPLIDDGYTLPLPEAGISSGNYQPQQDRSDDSADPIMAVAPQRRRARVPKVIPIDKHIELRNRDLLAMNNGYIDHMAADWKRITSSKSTAQAKKNAEYWLLGRGIAGVGDRLGMGGIKGPLAEMWSGDNLYLMITGQDRVTKGQKRESEDEDSAAERRVRPRIDDDLQFFHGEDDEVMRDYELEVGREGQESLEDISLAMPWNISASIRGSSVTRAATGAPGGPGSAAGSLTRRGSRPVSASPVIGRGIHSGVAAGESPTSDPAGFDDLGGFVGDDEFELYGPGADVDTQTAGQSQWQREVLDRESNNFLEFIDNALDGKRTISQATELAPANVTNIEFEELLPPEGNSRTVAAQGFLHVLTLGTKNLIRVTQKESFSPIAIELC